MGAFRRAAVQAMRMYRRIPLISLLAVLSLAVGICIAVTVFSVLDTILVKPLPFKDPGKVVFVWRFAPSGMKLDDAEYPWGLREFSLLREQSKTLETISAFKGGTFILSNAGDPITIEGLRVTPQFFSVFQTPPLLGSGFSRNHPTNDEVVLSYDLWRRRFAESRTIVGSSIDLNGRPYTVAGVMPREFQVPEASTMPNSFELPARPQLWVSLPTQPVPTAPGGLDDLVIVARLAKHSSLAQAQQELNLFAQAQNRSFPAFSGWFASRLATYHDQVAGRVKTPLLLIQLAVLVVVAICCVNVANLLLVLALSRQAEFSVRAAVGATIRDIVKQVVVESGLLSLAAGIIGIALSVATINAVRHLAPPSIPRLGEATINGRVILFSLGLTIVCGIGTGLIPALWATRGNIFAPLREGHRTSGSKSDKVRNVLLGAQIALALMLVVATGLLGHTIARLAEVDPGFVPNNRVSFQVYLPAVRYATQDAEVTALHELITRFQAMPGVRSAGMVSSVPLSGVPPELTTVRFRDRPDVPARERPFVNYSIASPSYFSTAGISLIRGRELSDQDVASAPRVALINQTMARRFWPQSDPIGKTFDYGTSQIPAMMIVGIVADVKHKALREEAGPEVYVPYTQHPWSSMQNMQFIVRATPVMHLQEASLLSTMHSLDGGLAIEKYAQWNDLLSDSTKELRFAVTIIGAFGLLSLLLASLGIYGVMSFVVQRRTREIGIRMALGSQRAGIFKTVLFYGMAVAACGIGAGVVCAVGVAFALRHYLFGVPIWDPVVFIVSLGVVSLVTAGACCIPAIRAMSVEPMKALRAQ